MQSLPQPADFYAAALPDCFHRTLCGCFKKQGFLKNEKNESGDRCARAGEGLFST